MEKSYIVVAGYMGTGASAVVDLLKEYSGSHVFDTEIRMIKDPYGLLSLEQIVLSLNWDVIRSSTAIWDFLDASKIWSRYGKSPLSPPGLSYKKTINKNYMTYTREFVSKICDFTFRCDFYSDAYRKNYFKYVIDRNRRYIEKITKGKLRIANRKTRPDFLCKPSQARFLSAAQEYLAKLFAIEKNPDDVSMIVLDQAISANNPLLTFRYFKNGKIIIVDRDPRDVFVDNMEYPDFLVDNPNSIEEAQKFCNYFLAVRDQKNDDGKNVLYVQFENLIYCYEKEIARIQNFTGCVNEEHTMKNQYFVPEKSLNNIGIWKKHYEKYKTALDYISDKLVDYLYLKKDVR